MLYKDSPCYSVSYYYNYNLYVFIINHEIMYESGKRSGHSSVQTVQNKNHLHG